MSLAKIEEAVEAIRRGEMIILVDDEDRENEGDLVIAAEFATPEAINFMATYGRGLICAPLTAARVDELGLPMMVPQEANSSGFGTPFTISVEAKKGVTTGISAHDRSTTIQTLIDPNATGADLAMPGHVFPLRAQDRGVLVRRGQTEGSVDLAKLAGLYPAAVICEIMNDDGTMARMPQLKAFAEKHGVLIVSVEQLVQYRLLNEKVVDEVVETRMPTDYGEFKARIYVDRFTQKEHIVFINDDFEGVPTVRVHSECMTGDVFGSQRCDCGDQLAAALHQIGRDGGALVYMRQEGRGIGLINKLKAYALQDQGYDTVEANLALGLPADGRDYVAAAHILHDIGMNQVALLTNNPAKVDGLRKSGIEVVERLPLIIPANGENAHYLKTKRTRMGHLFPILNGTH